MAVEGQCVPYSSSPPLRVDTMKQLPLWHVWNGPACRKLPVRTTCLNDNERTSADAHFTMAGTKAEGTVYGCLLVQTPSAQQN